MYRTNAKSKNGTPLSKASSVPWWNIKRHFRAWAYNVPHRWRVSRLVWTSPGWEFPKGLSVAEANYVNYRRNRVQTKRWVAEGSKGFPPAHPPKWYSD